jgi:hypothetical protein
MDEDGGRDGRLLEGFVEHSIVDGIAPAARLVALKREVVPLFDERFTACEDVEWWLRLSRLYRVTTVPRVGCRVRRHEGPRHGTGSRERVEARLRILNMYEQYFASHPRALAFAWKRIGLTAAKVGDHRMARSSYRRSLAIRPEPRTMWHLLRSFRPTRDRVLREAWRVPHSDMHDSGMT